MDANACTRRFLNADVCARMPSDAGVCKCGTNVRTCKDTAGVACAIIFSTLEMFCVRYTSTARSMMSPLLAVAKSYHILRFLFTLKDGSSSSPVGCVVPCGRCGFLGRTEADGQQEVHNGYLFDLHDVHIVLLLFKMNAVYGLIQVYHIYTPCVKLNLFAPIFHIGLYRD